MYITVKGLGEKEKEKEIIYALEKCKRDVCKISNPACVFHRNYLTLFINY